MRIALVTLFVGIGLGCGGSGGPRPQVSAGQAPVSSALQPLRGDWTLVGFDAQGPRRATGRLRIDEFNNVILRAELEPGEAGATPPRVVVADFTAKAAVSSQGELTYIGLEPRSPQEAMVPLGAEPAGWRHYSVEGDTLVLWQEDARGQRVGVMTFRRVN